MGAFFIFSSFLYSCGVLSILLGSLVYLCQIQLRDGTSCSFDFHAWLIRIKFRVCIHRYNLARDNQWSLACNRHLHRVPLAALYANLGLLSPRFEQYGIHRWRTGWSQTAFCFLLSAIFFYACLSDSRRAAWLAATVRLLSHLCRVLWRTERFIRITSFLRAFIHARVLIVRWP